MGTAEPLLGRGLLRDPRGERYNPDLLATFRGWGIYERMLRDDQIVACLSIINAAVTGREWSFEVTDQASQGPVLEFLRFNLNQALRGTVRQLLEHLLSARVFGFAVVEKLYGAMDFQGQPRWGLTGFKLRPAWTFSFQTDAHGNVQALIQEQGDQRVELERVRFIHYVYQAEYDLQYGRSALVAAYDPWWSKTNLLKLWNIYLERMAAGFVHGKKGGALSPADNAALQQALNNLQAATSILTPESVTLQYVTPPNTTVFQDREASLNRAIARALLLPMHLGFTDQGSTGSLAQATTQLEVFFWWVDALCTALEDTLNEQVFRDLVAWNFGAVVPPRFRFERRSAEQQRQIAKAWAEAVGAGTVTPGPEDELRVRQLLGMPVGAPQVLGTLVPLEDGGGTGDGSASAMLATDAAPGEPTPRDELARNPLDSAAEWVRLPAPS